jgi:hypothetical protein
MLLLVFYFEMIVGFQFFTVSQVLFSTVDDQVASDVVESGMS